MTGGPLLATDPSVTREIRILEDVGEILSADGETTHYLEAGDTVELPVINAQPLVEKDAAEPVEDDASDEPADTLDEGDLLMAGMGDPDAMDTVGTADTDDTAAASTGGSTYDITLPTSGLPLGQLDALNADERRRAARKRGLDWPTTDTARDRLQETIHEVLRHEDIRVVDAPTSLGKTHTIASTRWGAHDHVTGDRPVVHLLETRDARDEAAAVAEEHGGEHLVLRSRHEACPLAAGDYDPQPDDQEQDAEPITVDGQPASDYIRELCNERGLPFSAVHRRLEARNDQDRDLPCTADGECPAIAQWTEYREGEYPLVIGTHNFAHVPGLRLQTNVVIDEEPDFSADLSTDRVRRAVGAYLRAIDAPVSTWEAFIQLADHEGYGDDAAAERDALQDALDRTPDREWYFENANAHTLAPALARAIFHAEERANGRRAGKTRYEPPRLDAEARDDDRRNVAWVSVVLDEANDIRRVRSVPDFGATRSVVGLDAHPSLPVWQANTHPDIQRRRVLDPEERRLWRRYERGLRVVQVGDATRPLASGDYFDWDGTQAVVEHLRERYGSDLRTAITADAVEGFLVSIMDQAGVRAPETMCYGEKSRNELRRRAGRVRERLDRPR